MNFYGFLISWQFVLFVVFCVVAALQVFYYLFFFLRLAIYKPGVKDFYQTHPVSVIICARDEAANLADNLPGALKQQYATTHEVIVVNDNSYDESKYLLEGLQKEFRHLRPIELTQEAKHIPGKKFPLSIGIKSAKHEIVLLTDADCVPATEHWIESMQHTFDSATEIVLGYGPYHKRRGLLNKLVRWETFQTAMQYFSYALAGIPYMGVGRNLSYKRDLFFRNKGFSAHNHVPGGDDDLFINQCATKANTKINIAEESFTLSKPPKKWGEWFAQKQRHYTTSKYYKPKHKFLLGLFAFIQFLFYPLLAMVCIFYNWQIGLLILAGKYLVQGTIFYGVLKKLRESDLFPYFILLDIWMFFYYLIFAPSLLKKPRPVWK